MKASELQAILETWSKAHLASSQAPSVIQVQPVIQPTPVNVSIPEQPAPIINVTVPEQPAPQVTVNPVLPEMAPMIHVNVPEAKAGLPQEVRITEMPSRVHSLIRDKTGKPTGSLEEDA